MMRRNDKLDKIHRVYNLCGYRFWIIINEAESEKLWIIYIYISLTLTINLRSNLFHESFENRENWLKRKRFCAISPLEFVGRNVEGNSEGAIARDDWPRRGIVLNDLSRCSEAIYWALARIDPRKASNNFHESKSISCSSLLRADV